MRETEKRRELLDRIECQTLTTKQRCIVWALCRNDLKVKPAAGELFYGKSSLAYQIEKIKEKTGLDPRNFYDAIKLLAMIGTDPTRD